ncbi:MAG: S-ribosylhomocysteine lyase [Prevotella sp.]|nr:S-ribosylhomocysteine lyase [Prevotella sp.]
MELIASFKVNHLKLLPGLYVSRKDKVGEETVTTFDLRFTAPNIEPVMDVPAVHTIEHLGATFLRNSRLKDEVVYFGPMGCRTGFYFIIAGDYSSEAVFPLVEEMIRFIIDFEGDIPGATPEQCGNYQDQNLDMAKYYARNYLQALAHRRFVYP